MGIFFSLNSWTSFPHWNSTERTKVMKKMIKNLNNGYKLLAFKKILWNIPPHTTKLLKNQALCNCHPNQVDLGSPPPPLGCPSSVTTSSLSYICDHFPDFKGNHSFNHTCSHHLPLKSAVLSVLPLYLFQALLPRVMLVYICEFHTWSSTDFGAYQF